MEEIRKVVIEIEKKIVNMRSSLSDIKTENSALKSEIQVLSEKLEKREAEAIDFREKYETIKQQFDYPAPVNEKKDEQIDVLVREIDDCISRLKASE